MSNETHIRSDVGYSESFLIVSAPPFGVCETDLKSYKVKLRLAVGTPKKCIHLHLSFHTVGVLLVFISCQGPSHFQWALRWSYGLKEHAESSADM